MRNDSPEKQIIESTRRAVARLHNEAVEDDEFLSQPMTLNDFLNEIVDSELSDEFGEWCEKNGMSEDTVKMLSEWDDELSEFEYQQENPETDYETEEHYAGNVEVDITLTKAGANVVGAEVSFAGDLEIDSDRREEFVNELEALFSRFAPTR